MRKILTDFKNKIFNVFSPKYEVGVVQVVTEDEFIQFFGESNDRTNIECLRDSVGVLNDFIIRLAEEDSERFRARMSMKLTRIEKLTKDIKEEYELS